jgi:sortase (surface protein transpeptidase)
MKQFIVIAIFLFMTPMAVHAAYFSAPPTKIIIPALNLSLPVHTSEVIFNTWEVHLDGASFGEGTTLPGNKGNTAIFSHARVGQEQHSRQ